MKLAKSRHGFHRDPRGAHVVMYYQPAGRDLLGEVVGAYYDEVRRATLLRVRHFNGEPWPIDPAIYHVDVLERTYANDQG